MVDPEFPDDEDEMYYFVRKSLEWKKAEEDIESHGLGGKMDVNRKGVEALETTGFAFNASARAAGLADKVRDAHEADADKILGTTPTASGKTKATKTTQGKVEAGKKAMPPSQGHGSIAPRAPNEMMEKIKSRFRSF